MTLRLFTFLVSIFTACAFTGCAEMTTKDFDENLEVTKLLQGRLSKLGLTPIEHGEEVDLMEKGLCYLPTEDCQDPRIHARSVFTHHDAAVVVREMARAMRDTNYPRSVLVLESYTDKKLFLISSLGVHVQQF